MQFTDEQSEAIERADQDLVILAGAGSGKTMVLTEMVVRLIREKQVDPASIVLITFTEKAAGELKERLCRRLEKPLSFLEGMPVGTIHSFAARLLREESQDLPSDFVIWDESRSMLERSRTVHQELKKRLQAPSDGEATLAMEYGWSVLHNLLSRQLAMRWKLEAIKGDSFSANGEIMWAEHAKLYESIRQAYQEHKQRHGALDFEDLEEEAVRLLQDRARCAVLQQRYAYLFVDEYQDISPLQYQVIQSLYAPGLNHLVVVGDPLQSIYRFRGADLSLFTKTKESLVARGGQELHLLTNFRTQRQLIDQLQPVFNELFGAEFLGMSGIREDDGGGLLILDLPESKTLGERREAEVECVLDQLETRLAAGTAPDEIAILFRTRAAMERYEDGLAAREIPYHSQQGDFLLEQPEVVDQLNVFRALLYPEDSVAWAGVLRCPLGGLSDDALWVLKQSGSLAWDAKPLGLDAADQKHWQDISAWWQALREEVPALKASELAQRLLRRVRSRAAYQAAGQWQNLKAWHAFLQWMEEIDPFDLKEMLEVVEGFRADGARIPAWQDPAEQTGVQLMTVHGAKGLEFSVVVVADLGSSLPSPRDPILAEPGIGVGMKRLDAEAVGLRQNLVDTETYQDVKAALQAKEWAESRRLLYVACTRACDELWLPLARNKKEKRDTWNKWLCEALET